MKIDRNETTPFEVEERQTVAGETRFCVVARPRHYNAVGFFRQRWERLPASPVFGSTDCHGFAVAGSKIEWFHERASAERLARALPPAPSIFFEPVD